MKDDYYSIREWWDFRQRWKIPLRPFFKGTNSYIGFFYTRVGESSNAAQLPASLQRRHAWLAVYRRVNAHFGDHGKYELVIWDSDAPRRCPGDQRPTEDDLLPMQRQLVDYVREHVSAEDNRSRLERVWLGGFVLVHDGGSMHNIDQTADFLEAILDSMRSLKKHLPAPDHYMPERGFRVVERSNGRRQSPPPATRGSLDSGAARTLTPSTGTPAVEDAADQDRSGDEGADTRVIFHPPRGKTYKTHQRSECTNNLYEQARLCRLRGGNAAAAMRYEFKPTLEWYEQQKAEGRGFEHVNVANWKDVFESINLTPRVENTAVNRRDSTKASDPRE